jgi:hypothetical protein
MATAAPQEFRMLIAQPSEHSFTAVAVEVLPQFGLAFVEAAGTRTWAVTRSMPGPGLDALREGQRVKLQVEEHAGFSLIRSYALAD